MTIWDIIIIRTKGKLSFVIFKSKATKQNDVPLGISRSSRTSSDWQFLQRAKFLWKYPI